MGTLSLLFCPVPFRQRGIQGDFPGAPRYARCAFVAALLVAGVLACGRKAPLRPPEDVAPKRIADLSASNAGEGIQLAWSRPRVYADGEAMQDLGGFIVERAEGREPQATFRRITVLDVNDRDRFRQLKRFRYTDRDVLTGATYQYRVVSFTLDRYFSAPSNVVTAERSVSGSTAPSEERHAPFPAAQR
jgi:predicted small lipoprotein YifL